MLPVERRFSSSGRRATGADLALRIPGGRLLRSACANWFERGVAGAAEAVDRLVVVADDDDVVGLVRAAPDKLQQQDLGHVRVLELVHEHVAELVLVAAQDVGPLGEQLDRAQLLLAEVEQAALAQGGLVDRVRLRLLGQAHARRTPPRRGCTWA